MTDFKIYNFEVDSNSLAKKIYKISSLFPNHEIFEISQQMHLFTVLIPSNIAAGCLRSSVKEFSRFIQISLGSSYELETQIIITKNIEYITPALKQMIVSLKNNLTH